jgi:hypothetical protein
VFSIAGVNWYFNKSPARVGMAFSMEYLRLWILYMDTGSYGEDGKYLKRCRKLSSGNENFTIMKITLHILSFFSLFL